MGAHVVEHGQRRQGQQYERHVAVGRAQLAREQVDHGSCQGACRQVRPHVLLPAHHEHLGPQEEDEREPAAAQEPGGEERGWRDGQVMRCEVEQPERQRQQGRRPGERVVLGAAEKVALQVHEQEHGQHAHEERQLERKRQVAGMAGRIRAQEHEVEPGPERGEPRRGHWKHGSHMRFLHFHSALPSPESLHRPPAPAARRSIIGKPLRWKAQTVAEGNVVPTPLRSGAPGVPRLSPGLPPPGWTAAPR